MIRKQSIKLILIQLILMLDMLFKNISSFLISDQYIDLQEIHETIWPEIHGRFMCGF